MDCGNVSGQLLVLLLIGLIEEQENEVETRQECLRQINVLIWTLPLVVPSIDRVSRCKDRSPRIKASSDASFCDRDSLLLHDLVDVGAISLIHFVKLVNATNSSVCENESTAFKYKLSRNRVLKHSCCQTNTRATLARGVNATRREVGDMLEKLRLGDTRVTHEQHVHVTSDFHSVVHLLCDSTNHQK